MRHCCVAKKGMALPLPFPQLFSANGLPRHRNVAASSQNNAEADAVPILTRLASSSAVQPLLEHSRVQFESEPLVFVSALIVSFADVFRKAIIFFDRVNLSDIVIFLESFRTSGSKRIV